MLKMLPNIPFHVLSDCHQITRFPCPTNSRTLPIDFNEHVGIIGGKNKDYHFELLDPQDHIGTHQVQHK